MLIASVPERGTAPLTPTCAPAHPVLPHFKDRVQRAPISITETMSPHAPTLVRAPKSFCDVITMIGLRNLPVPAR